MTRLRHELRFLLGLYPIAGWLVGTEIHSLYPEWYVYTTIILFSFWALYESVMNYIQYNQAELILLVNMIGIIAEIDLMYLITKGFPINVPTNMICTMGYIYLIAYITAGIIINIMELKE